MKQEGECMAPQRMIAVHRETLWDVRGSRSTERRTKPFATPPKPPLGELAS